MKPIGSPLVDKAFRLESREKSPEKREEALRQMEAFCQQQGAEVWWERVNLLDPTNTEQILYVKTNASQEMRLRKHGWRKGVAMSCRGRRERKQTIRNRINYLVQSLQGVVAG